MRQNEMLKFSLALIAILLVTTGCTSGFSTGISSTDTTGTSLASGNSGNSSSGGGNTDNGNNPVDTGSGATVPTPTPNPVVTNPTPVPGMPQTTTFVSLGSRLCLQNSGSTGVAQAACAQNTNQKFDLTATSDGYYTIKNESAALCLESTGASASAIALKACSGADAQKWSITPASAQEYGITAKAGGCFNLWNGGGNSGDPLYTYDCVMGANELFELAGFTPIVNWPVPASVSMGVAPMLASQDQHEDVTQRFETWLGHALAFALDFAAQDGWSSMVSDLNWASGIWKQKNANRRLMWSIPLTTGASQCTGCGTKLGDVAAGLHDSEFTQVAATLASNQPNAIIRIGWEFNGGWYVWGAKGYEQDYINAFRRVVGIFRKASPQFTFVWCSNLGEMDVAPGRAYPGDDVVDVIGMDVYDFNYSNRDAPTRWADIVTEGYGLQWQVYFAHLHKKLLSFPEWGAGQNGDNSLFVQNMAAWVKANHFAYQSWWEGDAGTGFNSEIENSQFPLEAVMFKQSF